jgi:phage terminase large subunit GpA-like protein
MGIKPVQVGATEILLNTAGFYLAHAPSIVMIVGPNQGMVKRLSRQRIEPLIELCERMAMRRQTDRFGMRLGL